MIKESIEKQRNSPKTDEINYLLINLTKTTPANKLE